MEKSAYMEKKYRDIEILNISVGAGLNGFDFSGVLLQESAPALSFIF